jgi:hypothetical protein
VSVPAAGRARSGITCSANILHRQPVELTATHLTELVVSLKPGVFGDGVNIAARLEALADSDGICISRISRVVRDQGAPDRGSRVRSRLAGGGSEIRTLGPPQGRQGGWSAFRLTPILVGARR